MKKKKKMSEITDAMYNYAKKKNKNVFSKEEIIEVVGRDGMRALQNWEFLQCETPGEYKLSEFK